MLFWVFLLVIIIILFNLVPNKRQPSRQTGSTGKEKYLEARKEHEKKLYTFGQVQVSPLTVSLEKIKTWSETYYQPAARSLNPGLTRKQIQQALKDLPLTPVEELYTLYSWHNGQRNDVVVDFIPGYNFLSLENAVKEYRMMREASKSLLKNPNIMGRETWPTYYFPILSFQDSFYVVLCGGDKPGIVLDLLLEDPDPAAAYPNITVFMQEITEYFQTGAYYINDEGELVTDAKKKQMVFKKYHPAFKMESNKNGER